VREHCGVAVLREETQLAYATQVAEERRGVLIDLAVRELCLLPRLYCRS